MKYERLTKRNKDGSAIPINSPKSDYIATAQEEWAVLRQEIYNRLAELEDDIESGKIVRLPCKVGDTVYMPWVWDGASGVAEMRIKRIGIIRKMIFSTDLDSDDGEFMYAYQNGSFLLEQIGKKVFLTKAEAEAKLKELLGE